MLPSNIMQRQPIHHGVSRSWWKPYQRRTNEKQIRRIHNKCLSDIMDKAGRIRHSTTNNTHPWQRSLRIVQSRNQEELHNAVSSTRGSSTKFSRKSNTNIQKSLQSNNYRGRQQFPNELMGQTIATNSTYLEPVMTIKYCSNSLSLPIRSWSFRLWWNAIGTNGMCSTNSQKEWEKRIMGI